MIKHLTIGICFLLWQAGQVCGQQGDSLRVLDSIRVKVFGLGEKNNVVANVHILRPDITGLNNKISFVQTLNIIPGVRMEERSPGSYRISIRGSSLRSPFGVRNVKIYWNDIPVTDPGGNTYFNGFAVNNIAEMELFKGPASSLYGMGTGGLLMAQHLDAQPTGINAEYVTGTYNLQNVLLDARWNKGPFREKVSASYAHSNGYRDQSAMSRKNIVWSSSLKMTARQQLNASILYTDLYYQTPGGLTLQEYINNPCAARPAAGKLPSAVDANASIIQRNFLAGVTYKNKFSPAWQNLTSVYGAFAGIENAAIRNYEKRKEPHFGGRSVFSFQKRMTPQQTIQWHTGMELQQGDFNSAVSGNKNGKPDTLQTNDDINIFTYSIFTQATWSYRGAWFVTAGISTNQTKYAFTRYTVTPVSTQRFSFNNQWAPRIALSHKWNDNTSVLASVSKGFSPPTTAELLPSTGILSPLQPEQGWNYELNARQKIYGNLLQAAATLYYFNLNHALVQQRDAAGADYFLNAGNERQMGVELQASGSKVCPQSIVAHFSYGVGYAYSHFIYRDYRNTAGDHSDNSIPGVPKNSGSVNGALYLKNGFYGTVAYYAASKIFLNDANTASADGYHLLGGRLGFTKSCYQKIKLQLYIGADNILNENYSLGNDINAAGGRYYNAAPKRNYFAGIVFGWLR